MSFGEMSITNVTVYPCPSCAVQELYIVKTSILSGDWCRKPSWDWERSPLGYHEFNFLKMKNTDPSMGAKSKAKTHPPNTFFDPLSRSPRIRPQCPKRGQTWPKENLLWKNPKGVKNADPQSYPEPAEKGVKNAPKKPQAEQVRRKWKKCIFPYCQ
jgi:hypothetical protein